MRERRPQRPCSEHRFGQRAFGHKPYSLRDPNLREPLPIVGPLHEQVQRPIYERRALFGGISQEHPYLAVLLAGGTRVLTCHPHRLLALLQKTGLIDDQGTTVFVAEMLDYVLTQIITNGVWIPAGVSWSGFTPRC